MRQCDSSSAANTIASFSFDCLAGYTTQIPFLLLLTVEQIVMFAWGTCLTTSESPHVTILYVEYNKCLCFFQGVFVLVLIRCLRNIRASYDRVIFLAAGIICPQFMKVYFCVNAEFAEI